MPEFIYCVGYAVPSTTMPGRQQYIAVATSETLFPMVRLARRWYRSLYRRGLWGKPMVQVWRQGQGTVYDYWNWRPITGNRLDYRHPVEW